MRHSLLALAGLGLLTATAHAQTGIGTLHTDNFAGDLALPPGALNVDDAIFSGLGIDPPLISGVVRLPNGNYLVSSTRHVAGTAHKYYEVAADGTVVVVADQPDRTAVDPVGFNDLAWDGETGASSRVWAGMAGSGINSYDWNAGVFDPNINPGNLQTGLKIMDGWIGNFPQGAAIVDVGGQKVFVSADIQNPNFLSNPTFAGTPVNYHLLGSFTANLPKFQEPTPDISYPDVTVLGQINSGKWGAAGDPINGTVWWHVDLPTASPNPNASRTRFVEMDMNGNVTGQVFQGDRGVGGVGWGCEMYVNGDGDLVMVYLVGVPEIDPNADAVLVEVDAAFNFGSSCGGEISYSGEPFIGSSEWTINLDNAPSNPFDAAILFRGQPLPAPGTILPGLNNCGLLVDLAGVRSLGALPLVNGTAAYVQNLPEDTGLVGLRPTYQWLLPSSMAILPLDLSDAGIARVGTSQ
ncbi:MAG: hypothetical protein ACYTG5_21365 [Planctomycetota bacterium]|jgi:hypothetical protein